MSDYQTLAGQLIYRLGNRSDIGPATDLTAKVYEFLFSGMVDLAHRLKIVGINIARLEADTTFTVSANTIEVPYTTIDSTNRLYAILKAYNVTDSQKMDYEGWDLFEEERLQGDTGPPRKWTSRGRIFMVRPQPTVDTSVKAVIYNDPAPITSLTQTPEADTSYEDGMLLLAEKHGWNALGQKDRSVTALADFKDWLREKITPAEREKGGPRTRGFRPHPSRIADYDLGI